MAVKENALDPYILKELGQAYFFDEQYRNYTIFLAPRGLVFPTIST